MNRDWKTKKVLAGAVVLLLGAGALHRSVRLARASAASAFRPLNSSLANIPPRLDRFSQSHDVPISAEVLQVAGVDSFLNREYRDPVSGHTVQLYVGYWGYENLGMGHGPEVCYPVAGWAIGDPAEHRVLQFTGSDGLITGAEVALHHFTRTRPLEIERRAVAFLAVVDGRFRPSSRGLFRHEPPTASEGGFLAHVQVSTTLTSEDWATADTCIVEFMAALLPHVSRCLFGGPAHAIESNSDEHSAPRSTGGTRAGN